MIKRPAFRSDIEGVRGIAILLVVAYHASVPGLTGGFVGVDVFFVLSGYLITWLLVQEIEATGRIDLIKFYARRARRLLPALALVLFVTVLAGYVISSPVEQRGFARAAFATAAYASNLSFAQQSTDYLGAKAEANPLLHTWSLSVEEQFYLFWPLLILLALGSKFKFSAIITKRAQLLFIMTIVAAASFSLSFMLTHTHQPWAFFSSPTRAWEFAVGGLGILLPLPARTAVTRAAGWLGLATLLYSATAFNAHTIFPGAAALLPVLGTVAILRAGAQDVDANLSKYLSASWLQWLGRLSYSWYLWHWPVLIFGVMLFGELTLTGRLNCLAFALGLAAVSYRLVENPIRRSQLLARRSAYSIAMAVILTFFGLGTALVWRQVSRNAAESPAQIRITKASQDIFREDRNCMSDFTQTRPDRCAIGNDNASITIALFGDSHAMQWLPAIKSIVATKGWRLAVFTKAGCSPANISYVNPTIGRRYVECEQWRDVAIKQIKEMRTNLVIIAASQQYITGEWKVSRATWLAGMKRTLEALQASGARIVYLRDTPQAPFDIPTCLARATWQASWRRPSSCTFDHDQSLNEGVHQLDRLASANFKNLTYVDLTEYICPGSTCEPERKGLIMYGDTAHLTESFVISLTPVLKGILEEAIRPQP